MKARLGCAAKPDRIFEPSATAGHDWGFACQNHPHSAFAPHQIVAQRWNGRVEAVRAEAGHIFVFPVAVAVPSVRIKAALLHDSLRWCRLLRGVKLKARQDFLQQRGFAGGKACGKLSDNAAVFGVLILSGMGFSCVCLENQSNRFQAAPLKSRRFSLCSPQSTPAIPRASSIPCCCRWRTQSLRARAGRL